MAVYKSDTEFRNLLQKYFSSLTKEQMEILVEDAKMLRIKTKSRPVGWNPDVGINWGNCNNCNKKFQEDDIVIVSGIFETGLQYCLECVSTTLKEAEYQLNIRTEE